MIDQTSSEQPIEDFERFSNPDELAKQAVDLVYADKGEGVVEYKGQNPTIKDIFDLTRNPETNKFRAVAVPIDQMPVALKQILNFVGELDYVARYTDEIVFSPVLRITGDYILEAGSTISPKNSIDGAVNMRAIRDAQIRPDKRIMFINIGKRVAGQMQPREEFEMYDRIVHEARHREALEKITNDQESFDNRDNIALMERIAYQRQIKVLNRLSQAYAQKGLTNDVIYLYLKDRINHTQIILDALDAI